MVVADRLNRPLGWTRASWTAFATERLREGEALRIGRLVPPPNE